MKKIMACVVGLGSMILVATLLAQEKSEGFVEFGKLPAATDREFVEINVGRTLFAITAKFFDKSDPEAAKLLRGLQLVQVNVVGLAEENRAEVQERVTKLRADLTGKGWERIVTVKDKKDDVAIYLKTKGEEAIEGIVITVLDGDKEAVLVNIVGNIKPEQVASLGEKMNLEPLKKFAGALKK